MQTLPPEGPRGPDVHGRQEEDRINFPKIIIVGVVSLVVFTIGIIATYAVLAARDEDVRGPGSTAGAQEIGRHEIGIVNQWLFEREPQASYYRRESAARLGSFGWVDRERGIIHVPIDLAIERLLVEGSGPRRDPAPALGPPGAVAPDKPLEPRPAGSDEPGAGGGRPGAAP